MSLVKQRYFVEIAFDGSNYHGWQIQNNSITVQEVIDEKLSILLREKTITYGQGRTDAGVHAKYFVFHFETEKEIPINFVYKFNSLLPFDIAAHSIHKVKEHAHARFSAFCRAYQYSIYQTKNPFLEKYATFIPQKIDFSLMNEEAKCLVGTQDFSSFCKSNSGNDDPICTLYAAFWEQKGDEFVFTISANRFLRNMVRAVVGTLLEVGLGKQKPGFCQEVLNQRSRTAAGLSVPAKGLSLVKVDYREEIYIRD